MRGSVATGTIAGRWRLVREIGRGGFGTVMEAWDEKIGRKVAVKLVDRRALELAGGMHRFNREAKVLQKLAHPNVVRAFDAGEHQGTPYLVMEFLEGAPLDAALRAGGAMPAQRVAAIARDLLGALEEAHRFGVVHRDIKPANVFLAHIVGRELVKLLDFGIAKADGLDVAQTAMGATLGTAAYMAPEQVTGGSIGPPTDLFAVGLLVAEALCGRRVYGGGSGLAILVAKASGQKVELPPEVTSSALGQIVERAVEIDPRRRFASAREMADAIAIAAGSTLPSALGPAMGTDPLGATARVAELRASQPDAAWSAGQGTLAAARAAAGPTAHAMGEAETAAHAVGHAETAAHAMGHAETAAHAMGHAETAAHAMGAAAAAARALGQPGAAAPAPRLAARETGAPPRSPRRRWIAIVAIAIGVLGAGTAAVLLLVVFPQPTARSAARIELLRSEGPLRVFDRDRVEIFPAGMEGKFRQHDLVDCPALAAATLEDVGARLGKIAPARETYRGAIITEWTLREGQDDATEASHYRVAAGHLRGADVATVTATLAQRLRAQGPVLRGGANVLQLPAEGIDAAAVTKAICR